VSIHVPGFGGERIDLMAPETILWNRSSVLGWRDKPDITWTQRTAERAAYEMRLTELRVEAEFVAREDSVEQRFTAANLTEKPGAFRTSSCFKLQGLPMFYDCEQLRTYALSADGKFVPARRLARGDDCVRWINGLNGEQLGKDRRWAVLAVVSRDSRRIIATGRAAPGADFSVGTNTLFTCLHTDSTVPMAPGQRVTTRQLFWFIEGTLDDLLGQVQREFKPDF
jgi:hypothetical protein